MSAALAFGGWIAALGSAIAGHAALAITDLGAARRGARAVDRIETFELGELLTEVAAMVRACAWQRGARLELERPDGPVHLRGDRARLRQACGALLCNAIEHGGRAIVLRARASAHTARIEVLDDGPGLPAPVAVLIRHPGRGERGPGLALAADVAARFGGRLASAPSERGARLVLELPTAR